MIGSTVTAIGKSGKEALASPNTQNLGLEKTPLTAGMITKNPKKRDREEISSSLGQSIVSISGKPDEMAEIDAILVTLR